MQTINSALSIFFLLLLSLACSKSEAESLVDHSGIIDSTSIDMDTLDRPVDTIFSYLALGDSYTIGQGVAEEERWPMQLKDSLQLSGLVINDLKIIAKTGWTTTKLIDAIADENPTPYDLVSLSIGVNNQYQNKPFDLFETELEALLNTALDLTRDSNRVFVVSIPDYGVTPFGTNNSEEIGEELDQYNEYTAQRCLALGIPYVNITQISRELGSGENALAADNLHPSGFQYSKWVEEILPTVKELLIK